MKTRARDVLLVLVLCPIGALVEFYILITIFLVLDLTVLFLALWFGHFMGYPPFHRV